MAVLVGLLRGINLGARNRLGMAELRAVVEGLGYESPRTLLQSGNVVFGSPDSPDTTAKRIQDALARDAGLDVPVLVRTRAEMARIVKRNPLAEHATDPKFHHVMFLSGKADPAAVREIDAARYAPELFAAHGREVYVWMPGGTQASKLGHGFWEKRLGLAATARNWNTVTKLLEMASSS
jgi:uncharacterized protein (DUF1697 family)